MAAMALAWPAPLAAAAAQAETRTEKVSAAQLFDAARAAEREGKVAVAETIYRALAQDPNVDTRNEARFRHAQLLARQHKLADAATLYRAILDETPGAQRVRLELAAVLAQMGDLGAARRTLRQAQAGGLPPAVARVIDQYAAALRSLKPLSASIELSLAPTTNINRATSATTLDTVLAPFQLSDDARAQSGAGVRIGGQASAKLPVSKAVSAVVRLAGEANTYRQSEFDDWIGSLEGGVEATWGKARLRPLIGRSYRWYGTHPYATTDTASITLDRSLGRRALLSAKLGLGRADYRRNDLQDGTIYSGSATYERALSARTGGSVGVRIDRQDARDPGYATTAGAIDLLGWREAGKTTLYLSVSGSRLVADQRLALFPDTRRDWQFRATFGATLRQFTMAHFAPLVRVSYERNASTVGIYDYRRLAGEIGLSRAF